MRIDLEEEKKKRKIRERKRVITQFRQITAMFLFLVTNCVYKHNSEDMIVRVMFMVSYIIFLMTTVWNLRDLNILYHEIPKTIEEENNEE